MNSAQRDKLRASAGRMLTAALAARDAGTICAPFGLIEARATMRCALGIDPLPWEISRVTRSDRGGITVWGVNHYRGGERFTWHLDCCSFRDQDHNLRRHDFSRATFAPDGCRGWLLRHWPGVDLRPLPPEDYYEGIAQ